MASSIYTHIYIIVCELINDCVKLITAQFRNMFHFIKWRSCALYYLNITKLLYLFNLDCFLKCYFINIFVSCIYLFILDVDIYMDIYIYVCMLIYAKNTYKTFIYYVYKSKTILKKFILLNYFYN